MTTRREFGSSEMDRQLRQYYQRVKLPQQSLLMIGHREGSNFAPAWLGNAFQQRTPVLSMAAFLMCTITLLVHHHATLNERKRQTINDVALNHITPLQPEIKTSSIEDIDKYMSQLRFEVTLPDSLKNRVNVIGARYCTLNGDLAIHINVVDKQTEQIGSVFITRSLDRLASLNSANDQVNGIHVTFWSESGLFYAVASRDPLL